MPNMAETKDPVRLRLLSLELLKQLWAGHEAMCRSVVRAASGSNLDCSSNNLEMPLSQETSSASSVAPSSQDKRHMLDPLDSRRDDTFDVAWYVKFNSRMDSFLPATGQHQEPQEELRPPSVPLLATQGLKGPVSLGGPKGLGPDKTQVPRSILSRLSKPSKPRVTSQESAVPESSWHSRPYLGYDWIAELCSQACKRAAVWKRTTSVCTVTVSTAGCFLSLWIQAPLAVCVGYPGMRRAPELWWSQCKSG